MKIKKFKLNLSLKEVYNNLRQNNIKITPEIETMISITEQEIKEFIIPAVTTETFDIKDVRINRIIKSLQIPKNVILVTFIISTLGDKIEQFLSSLTDDVKKSVSMAIINEYLNSSLNFVVKILDEKTENDIQHGTLFVLPEEFYPDVVELLAGDKIGVQYSNETKSILPLYTTLNYMFWFKKKNK